LASLSLFNGIKRRAPELQDAFREPRVELEKFPMSRIDVEKECLGLDLAKSCTDRAFN
jgi:hypothetical protein